MVKRVGIIGYGHLGQFLVAKIIQDDDFELAFVWNRTKSALKGAVDPSLILDDLGDFAFKNPDIVVEVAHPEITKLYGEAILKHCDYMMGSPTALSDENMFNSLMNAATEHGLYISSGSIWGGQDLQKMSEAGMLRSLTVTIKKHPQRCLKLIADLKKENDKIKTEATTLYKGCVRDICSLAPSNTNIMAVAALTAPNLGFDGVTGCLISDPNLSNCYIVEVEAMGYPQKDGSYFHIHTIRKNPAVIDKVTGQATYAQAIYYGSIKRAGGKGPGLHLC